jgi:hypothetical protein
VQTRISDKPCLSDQQCGGTKLGEQIRARIEAALPARPAMSQAIRLRHCFRGEMGEHREASYRTVGTIQSNIRRSAHIMVAERAVDQAVGNVLRHIGCGHNGASISGDSRREVRTYCQSRIRSMSPAAARTHSCTNARTH